MSNTVANLKKHAAIRSIAMFEAAKGAAVLVVGMGLLTLLHKDVQKAAEHLVRRLHLNPARHYPRIFLEASSHMTDQKLWFLAAGAALYATVRFVEAFGLWNHRTWAEWFALVSTGLYLPVEAYELAQKSTPLRAAILLGNFIVFLYFAYERFVVARRPIQVAVQTSDVESIETRSR